VAKHKKQQAERVSAERVSADAVPSPRPKLTEMVPVRFPEQTLGEVRRRATADDRSVSAWIRRAVERELKRASN
jgi:hypothetical protein